ncbi:hypothetical protein B0T16DRAFT_414277 [Cercophora newfieldiana]|uniref:NACHT domain-containing protein n=1 Tax=Cercophora newfieldiana TaxID=92897 RepID=A0AA39Y681_9PEZI|nr:hypothetical protein B0T16DRAFT_414277 [Cercophora newfieldiana]
MAEIVAFGASIAAFIQLADRVISLSKFYLEALDDCPHDIKTVLEVASLKALLETVDFLIRVKPNAGDSPSVLSRLDGEDGPIQGCRAAVEMLEKMLPPSSRAPAQKRQKTADVLKQLAWPLRQSKATKLLAEISRYKESISLAITTDSSRDLKDIKANLSAIRQTLTEEQHSKFCEWVEHTNPTRRHNESYELHEDHTGAWVTRSPDWNSWIQGLQRFVWIYGIPGAGKTVLTSFLVEEAKRTGQTGQRPIVYYYCHFVRNQDEAKPLLRWLVGQLCRRSRSVPGEIMNLFKINHEPSVIQLLDALDSALREFDHVFFIIDAVDESFPRRTLLSVIRDLATDERFQKVRLLATSRLYIDIETMLAPIAAPISMENELVAEDIKVYTHKTLRSCSEFADWPENLLADVEDALVAGARGMFRWAFCQIDALQWLRPDEAKQAIRSLPKTLDETYERIFRAIRDEDYELVHTALSVIYGHECVTRPRVGYGLPVAILLRLLAPLLGGPGVDSASQKVSLSRLRRISGCLLSISKDQKIGQAVVELSHYTVKEYLLSNRLEQGPVSRFSLSDTSARRKYCRLVLLVVCEAEGWDEDFARDIEANPGPLCGDLVVNGGLLYYCEDDALDDQQLKDLYRRIFDPSRPSWKKLRLMSKVEFGLFTPIPYLEPPHNPDAAFFANLVSAGLLSLAKEVLQSGDADDMLYRTPIHTQTTGHTNRTISIMDLFRDLYGAFNQGGRFKDLVGMAINQCNPTAALYTYLGCHQHLGHGFRECRLYEFIVRGADLSGEGYRITPLQIAIYRLDQGAVEELLGRRAKVNGVGDHAGTAVLNGSFDIIPAIMTPLDLVGSLRDLGVDVESDENRAAVEEIEGLLLEYSEQHGGG